MEESHSFTLRQQIESLELFRSLIKDGAKWHGDIASGKYLDVLYIEDGDEFVRDQVMNTLMGYCEGKNYKFVGDSEIWIM